MQNFFNSLGAVGTMARANKNQQSPESPWMITFAVAPPTKNWGLLKIFVTRWTSAGEGFSLFCMTRQYKHLLLSFSKSNLMSLWVQHKVMLYQRGLWWTFCFTELSILFPTIFSNAFNFGFAVFDGFFELLGDKKANLFFCKQQEEQWAQCSSSPQLQQWSSSSSCSKGRVFCDSCRVLYMF